jgi:prepilin peptidase CpaA
MAATLCAPLRGAEDLFFPVARYVVLWIILALVIVATIFDLRTREVPDWIALTILTCSVLATTLGWGEVRWPGLIVGLLLGLACSAAVFYLGGLGGADVKLVAVLGAAVGPVTLLCVLFWTAIAGGLFALAAEYRGKREFAYVPAIAAGLLIQTLWPEGLRSVLFR